ncbi:MAG: hypothetical protein H7039_10670, partial [Bryobacteraceae bacterium]|nr:hypothetical protein [Bryobacteraceae bacterium]
EAIAKEANVTLTGQGDFITQANVSFLSEYHGQPAPEILAMHGKGASFIDINQQYRRVGMKPKTERSRSAGKP